MGVLMFKISLLALNMFQLTIGHMASLNDINLKNYSKVAIPYSEDPGKTVNVNVSMYILNIGSLDTAKMTFEIEMYFGMKWIDPRLAFKEYNNATYALVKGETAYENIWIPDLFVRNMKHTEKSSFLKDLSGVMIYPDGIVSLSSRIRVVAHCEMDLLMFPLDSQSCNLMIISYLYNTAVMKMFWAENPVVIDERRDGRETKLDTWMGFTLERTLTTEDSYVYPISNLEFQYMIATFVLKRQPQYFILRGFIPSSLLVCLTWASFWLPTSSFPARVALIVTSFLASIVLYQGSTLHVHQMTVMQMFLLGNIAFIGLTLVEFLMAVKVDQNTKKKPQAISIKNEAYEEEQMNESEHKRTPKPLKDDKILDNSVDKKARFVIPIIYIFYVGVFVVTILLNQT
ncbi:glycine receptor subunit beta-type 4-like [Clytia hemisphaerica]|uniref:glycine receptor subunit beta-type 4-like n=1 Tax=Clytia hemisphaerica TaxID=252671 RepID=UPI0034D69E6D